MPYSRFAWKSKGGIERRTELAQRRRVSLRAAAPAIEQQAREVSQQADAVERDIRQGLGLFGARRRPNVQRELARGFNPGSALAGQEAAFRSEQPGAREAAEFGRATERYTPEERQGVGFISDFARERGETPEETVGHIRSVQRGGEGFFNPVLGPLNEPIERLRPVTEPVGRSLGRGIGGGLANTQPIGLQPYNEPISPEQGERIGEAIAPYALDPTNLVPGIGFTKVPRFLRGAKAATEAVTAVRAAEKAPGVLRAADEIVLPSERVAEELVLPSERATQAIPAAAESAAAVRTGATEVPPVRAGAEAAPSAPFTANEEAVMRAAHIGAPNSGDSIARLARKHGINPRNKTPDEIIDELRTLGAEAAPDTLAQQAAQAAPPSPALDAETAAAQTELERLGLPSVGGGNPIQRLTELIKAAKPVRTETELLKSQELRRRAGAVAGTIEGAQGRAGLPKALSQLKGELPRAQFEAPESLLKTEEIDDLFRNIWRSDNRPFQKLNTAQALEKLLTGQIPTRGEILLLEKQFGKELAQAILSKRGLGAKLLENLVDAANIPRALVASWDASAPLRQAVVLTIAHPKESIPDIAAMFRSMASEKYAKLVDDAIQNGPNAALKQDSGLYIAPFDSAATQLVDREESFMSAIAERIPGIKQSQRGYITYLNKLRSDVFDTIAKNWEGMERTPEDYASLAKFINHATGRGDVGALRSMMPTFNAVFFSPRLLISRVQMPIDLFTSTPAARAIVARDLLAFVGTGLTILSVLKASGAADVEIDPRSSDFGKLRFGNQRIDFWAGYQPIARYTAQLLTGQRKTSIGDITSARRGDVVFRFLRSKLAPIPSLATDLTSGKTFLGEELKPTGSVLKDQAFNRLVPLFAQDLVESAKDGGLVGLFRAIPAGLGVGVQAYGGDKRSQAFRLRARLERIPAYEGLDPPDQEKVESFLSDIRAERQEWQNDHPGDELQPFSESIDQEAERLDDPNLVEWAHVLVSERLSDENANPERDRLILDNWETFLEFFPKMINPRLRALRARRGRGSRRQE